MNDQFSKIQPKISDLPLTSDQPSRLTAIDPYPLPPGDGRVRVEMGDLEVAVRVGDLVLWPGANVTSGGPLDDKTSRITVALLQHALDNLARESVARTTGAKP